MTLKDEMKKIGVDPDEVFTKAFAKVFTRLTIIVCLSCVTCTGIVAWAVVQ